MDSQYSATKRTREIVKAYNEYTWGNAESLLLNTKKHLIL